MKNEEIIQFLKSEPMKFTYAEIEKIMDDEIEKDPDDMDTDLIDLCAEVLCKRLDAQEENELNTNSGKKKHIKRRLAKIGIIAAIVAIIMGISVTASARYVYNDTSDKIVKFYEDHFSINLRGTNSDGTQLDDSEDLIAELKENGFDKVMLPSLLLTDEYIYEVKISNNEEFLTVAIDFINKNNNETITIYITKHKDSIDDFFKNEIQLTSNYDSAKQLAINGIEVFIFGNNEKSIIIYVNNDIDYSIDLNNFNFDSAVKIAESLK